MSYSKKILYFYKKGLFNYKLYSKKFNFCVFHIIGTFSCGDIFLFQLIFSYFNLLVFDFKYKVYGCGSAISSISLSSFYLINKYFYQILFLKDFYLSKKLNFPSIKLHCSVFSRNIISFCLFIYKSDYVLYFF